MVNEEELECYLEANGWTVWRPEDHPFIDRFAELSSAEVILMIEGAAFLSYLFFTRVDTKIFTLSRNDDTMFGNDLFFNDFFGIIGLEKPLKFHRLNLPKKWVNQEGTSARFELDLTAFRRLMEETRFLDSFDESGADMVRSFHHDRRRLIEEAVTTLGSVDTTPVKDQEHCYLSELEALRGNLDGAISEMEKAIAIHPELGHQHARLGLLWAEAGCHQSAVQSLERAVALPPKGDAALLSPNGYPPYHIELSGIYQKLGRLDEALRHASRAIELSPGHAGYHYHRGHILLLMDDLDGAETEILRSTELDPGLIEARALLAGIQMRKGDWIASRRNWERVLEIDPTRSDAHYFSGLSRHMINDLNGARDCYLKCLALDPDHEDARFRLSEAMTTAGEWTGALEQVQAAIGLNSESADFRLLQSHVLLMLNRFDEAKSASKNARKLKCGVWRWLILRGSIELRKWIEIGWRNGAHDREHFK